MGTLWGNPRGGARGFGIKKIWNSLEPSGTMGTHRVTLSWSPENWSSQVSSLWVVKGLPWQLLSTLYLLYMTHTHRQNDRQNETHTLVVPELATFGGNFEALPD